MIANAIFTPRGIKVRLPTDVAFGLMAQLRPAVRPTAVLETVEAIELTPTAASKLVALLCFLFQLPPIPTAVACCLARVVPNLASLAGFTSDPGLNTIGRWYRPIAGRAISLVIVAVIGILIAGPIVAAAFVIGTSVGGAINMLIDFLLMRRMDPVLAQPLSSSERGFLQALQWHAARTGRSFRLDQPTLDAAKGEAWREALADYAADHPLRAKQCVQETFENR